MSYNCRGDPARCSESVHIPVEYPMCEERPYGAVFVGFLPGVNYCGPLFLGFQLFLKVVWTFQHPEFLANQYGLHSRKNPVSLHRSLPWLEFGLRRVSSVHGFDKICAHAHTAAVTQQHFNLSYRTCHQKRLGCVP